MLDVRGSGSSWAVYRGASRISRYYSNHSMAETAAHGLERKARQQPRPCLCCGQTFPSEGAHNRMCTDCRRLDMGMMG